MTFVHMLSRGSAPLRSGCAPSTKHSTCPNDQALTRGFSPLRSGCAPSTKHSTCPNDQALTRGFCAPAPNFRPFAIYQALTRGFSLLEIVLALGVISFALVGIIGLFPVAMKSAQESQRETRATLIAQQIFSDLRMGGGTNRMFVRGPSPTNGAWVVTNFSLATDNNTVYLAYDLAGRALTTPLFSASSVPDADTMFVATIAVGTNTGITNLSRVQVTIETPAAAPTANRSKYNFVTLMNY